MQLKVVVNNVIHDERFKYGWGLSIFIEGLEAGLLFDTGPDGDLLLNNLKTFDISPDSISKIFISHIHLDHVGGLIDLLDRIKGEPTVYIPISIAREFEERVKRHGGRVVRIEDFERLFDGVYSTGQLGTILVEQSMVIKTSPGLVIITGCSHPKITKIVSHVRGNFLDEHIFLVVGGFHLLHKDMEYIVDVMKYLKEMGVEKISPSHCSGELAVEIAKEIFGEENYIDSGAGSIINIE